MHGVICETITLLQLHLIIRFVKRLRSYWCLNLIEKCLGTGVFDLILSIHYFSSRMEYYHVSGFRFGGVNDFLNVR